jgi:hypothetical protein
MDQYELPSKESMHAADKTSTDHLAKGDLMVSGRYLAYHTSFTFILSIYLV